MEEIFRVARANLQISGMYPLQLTAASEQSGREVLANSIIFSRMPNGKPSVLPRVERLSGQMGEPLPEYDWTETLADDVSELASNDWEDKVRAFKDEVWTEYLRVKGPIRWTQEEKPVNALLRFALVAEELHIEALSRFAHDLPHPEARRVLKQVVSIRFKVNWSREEK